MGASRFAGGSLAFRFLNQSRSDAWTVQISVLSGWKLGDGPCGPSCDNSRQGQPSNRSQVTAGDSSALGSWHVEDARGNTSGDLSASGLTGKMVAVNQGYGWEQELATFDVEVTEGDDVQIRWVGQDWVDVPYAWPNFQRGSSTPYSLAASLGTTNVRNDTGRPNSSPFAYFQMTYTAVLGERTEISLPVGDPDGDRVNCSEATYFLQGVTDGWDGLELGLRQDELLQSCVLALNPMQTGNFKNGSYVIISLELWDYLVYPISYEGIAGEIIPDNQPLSRVSVQFLVKLVDNEPPAPEILSPQEGESYWVYTGATLKVDVAARATTGRSITSLRLSSAPTFPGAMTSSVMHNGNLTSSIEYLADSAGVGSYSLEIIATDDAGHEARRHIRVAVREFDFKLPAVGQHILNYHNNSVSCATNVHCIFPFYAFEIQTSLTLIVPFASLAPSTPGGKMQVIRGYALGPNKDTNYKGVSAVEKDVTLPIIVGTGALNLFLTIMDGGQKVNLTVTNMMLRVTMIASSPCIEALCLKTDFGLCQADDTGTKCGCLPGTEGDKCQYDIDECASNSCHNNATCNDHLNYYECHCAHGYTGTFCETDIDECGSGPCQHGGTCKDKVNSYACDCGPGWTGNNCQTDIDECGSGPCQHGGTCHDKVNGYTCDCVPGWTGNNCQTDIDECGSAPCQNAGTCHDKVNGYTCDCVPGYTGSNCQSDIDECGSAPCQNGGTCHDKVNGYTCDCVPGYTRSNCHSDIDECGSAPCLNGGTCNDMVNSYTCDCVPGWNGTNCETDIDECGSAPCLNSGTCYDMVNSYTCQCAPGYTGSHCETDIDECGSGPCQNGGTCHDKVNGYTCDCVPGSTGTNCLTGIDDCSSGPCQNGGTCRNGNNSYTCDCVPGYAGNNCETDIDDCMGVNRCGNGGICRDMVNGYECDCFKEYTGSNCQTALEQCPPFDCTLDCGLIGYTRGADSCLQCHCDIV